MAIRRNPPEWLEVWGFHFRERFTMIFGGGVDVKANRAIAIRLIQADWLYYHFGSNTVAGVTIPAFSQSNNVRVSTGVVFRF